MQQQIDRWHELLTTDGDDDWTPPFNFTNRVNFLVFDILGDVCYRRSFKMMEPEENTFKAILRATVRLMTVIYAIAKSPLLHLCIYFRLRGISRMFKAI
jgi:hypothetical protein